MNEEYDLSNLTIDESCEFQPDEKERFRDLVKQIYEKWANDSQLENQPKAKLRQRLGGLSSVKVFELAFDHGNKPVAKFIIRQHQSKDDASKEKGRANTLAKGFGNQYFPKVVGKQFSSNVVVYQHVGHDTGASESYELDKYICDLLNAEDKEKVGHFTNTLKEFSRRIVEAYNSLETKGSYFEGGLQYYQEIDLQLPPDLIISGHVDSDSISSGKILIEHDNNGPDSVSKKQAPISATQLVNQLKENSSKNKWVKVNGLFPQNDSQNWQKGLNGTVYFLFSSAGDDVKIWISTRNKEEQKDLLDSGFKKREYELIFHREAVKLFSDKLEDIGFSAHSCLSRIDFQDLCKEKILDSFTLYTKMRHNDLHCGNVLVSGQSLKIIDVGDMKLDLLASDIARLEVSIWFKIAQKLSEAEAKNVVNGNSDASFKTRALDEVFKSLRDGFNEGMARSLSPEEEVLAYVTQILFYQRYCLLEHGVDKIQPAFDVFAGHWINKLRQIIEPPSVGHEQNESERKNAEVERNESTADVDLILSPNKEIKERENGEVDENKPATNADLLIPNMVDDSRHDVGENSSTEPENDSPSKGTTIRNLWEDALKNDDDEFEDDAEEFLEVMGQAENSILEKELTDLQSKLWDTCVDARKKPNDPDFPHPFHSICNVLLSAPTSSGKTAIAEIFLLYPLFHSDEDERPLAIYLAPTRALAQAKYRELRERYGKCNNPRKNEPLEEQIIVSTGEDTTSDNRLGKGKFVIASLVYEKANMVFSQRRELIHKIGCVVIDEMHMLQQTQRGAGLEMLIAKLLHEQRSYNMAINKLKIVGISTEGESSDAMEKLFTVISSGEKYRPIEITVTGRPVKIKHYLILPLIDEEQPFKKLLIGEFDNVQKREISKEKRKELRLEIRQVWKKYRNNKKGISDDIPQRTMNLLTSLLKGNQDDYRLLVFVPSKRDARNYANKIKSFLKSQKMIPWSMVNEDEFTQLTVDADGEDLLPTLLELASYGVFLHHADIDRQIRSYIEKRFSAPKSLEKKSSQVIFATQTLSYGINLALDDVVILAVDYPFTNRKGILEHTELNVCEFHNMAGRAGRLGKISREYANVYVVPKEQGCANMVEQYYNEPPDVESQLFMHEDSNKYWLLQDRGMPEIYKTLKFDDYTYPFARATLDALRHLTSKYSSARNTSYVSIEELQEFLSTNSLYFFQRRAKNSGNEDFSNCMKAVLWKCKAPAYELVANNGERYGITELGEAVINTGTDLNTIVPMLEHTSNFYKIWETHYKGEKFPTCLYILVVIAQEEIFLNKVLETPEGRNQERHWHHKMVQANRKYVKQNFQKVLAKVLGKSDTRLIEFINEVVQYLDKALSAPKTGTVDVGYPNGFTDVVLRFFCAVMAWTKMEGHKKINTYVQYYEGPKTTGRNMNGALTGFKQFTDQVSWKLLFLWNLIKKWSKSKPSEQESKYPILKLEQEIELLNLVSQVRIGCTAPGVALHYPSSSNFPRNSIIGLVKKEVTPTRLLSCEKITDHVWNRRRNRDKKLLLSDISNFALSNFVCLADEMEMSQDAEFDKQRQFKILDLWSLLLELFKKGAKEFSKDYSRNCLFDKQLRELFNDTLEAEVPTRQDQEEQTISEYIKIEEHTSYHGMRWKEYVQINKNKPWGEPVKIVGVQFNRNWEIQYNDEAACSLADLLKKEKRTSHLVLVSLPWVPYLKEVPEDVKDALTYRRENKFTTVLISPAAFATMTSAVVSRWVEVQEFMQKLRTRHDGSLMRLVLTLNILRICEMKYIAANKYEIPQKLREEVIKYYEVGNDYQDIRLDQKLVELGWKR